MVADALSREEKGSCQAITAVLPDWVKQISESYEKTDWLRDLLTQLTIQPAGNPGYTLSNGLIRFKGRPVGGDDKLLRGRILQTLHSFTLGRPFGAKSTLLQSKTVILLAQPKKRFG